MSDEPHLPFKDLPEPTILPIAWSGGTHDASRVTEEQKAEMRTLFVELKSIHAVAKATGHAWKTVRIVCCPEEAFVAVSPEVIEQVKALKARGARYAQIKAETQLPRATIAAILAADPKIAETIQKTRAARLLVTEEMLMEAQADAIETKLDAGRLTVGDATNALMVNGVLHEKAGGAAPTRIKHEADPSLLAAAAMFSAAFKPKPVLPAEGAQEAIIVPNKETQADKVES